MCVCMVCVSQVGINTKKARIFHLFCLHWHGGGLSKLCVEIQQVNQYT